MELGLTIPLQRFLHLPAPPPATEGGLVPCWDLHLLRPSGCASLLCVHASSRFAFLLYDVSAVQWADVPTLALEGIKAHLCAEGYSAKAVRRYTTAAGTPTLTRTHGRRPVAFLNRAVDDLYALPAGLQAGELLQPQLVHWLNDVPCRCAGHEGRGTARGFLRADMQAFV